VPKTPNLQVAGPVLLAPRLPQPPNEYACAGAAGSRSMAARAATITARNGRIRNADADFVWMRSLDKEYPLYRPSVSPLVSFIACEQAGRNT
jgi:hypothetical protein